MGAEVRVVRTVREAESTVVITVKSAAVSSLVSTIVVYTEVESTARGCTSTFVTTVVTREGDAACLDSVGYSPPGLGVITKVATTGCEAKSMVLTAVATEEGLWVL